MLKSFLLSMLTVTFSLAAHAELEQMSSNIFSELKSETQKCAVQILDADFDGKQKPTIFVSDCATLVIHSSEVAQVFVQGQWVTAKIYESEDSDGGDLYDLSIFDINGHLIAERTNTPAFGHVVLALAGSGNLRAKLQRELLPEANN